MRLVEHWFNQQWGWARRDIWLHEDGSGWWVTARQRQRETGQVLRRFTDEAEARGFVDELIRKAPGVRSDWRKVPASEQHTDSHRASRSS